MVDPDMNPTSRPLSVRTFLTRRGFLLSAGAGTLSLALVRTAAGGDDDHDDDHDKHDGRNDDRNDDIRPSGTAPAGSTEVIIDDDDADAFEPGTITIDLGQSVTWVNLDDDPHTATGATFDTGRIEPGALATVTFDEPGTYPYSYQYHPIMTGVVEVRDETGQVPSSSASSPDASPVATRQGTPQTGAGGILEVAIADFAFDPAGLAITAGSTVRWTNRDSAPHTATSTSGEFDSGTLDQGDTFEHTFNATGTYDYICAFHPSMEGRITVTG